MSTLRRSKVLAAWLAFLLGAVGAHRWYLRQRHAWRIPAFSIACLVSSSFYPVFWNNAAFFLLIIPMIVGFIEALVLALKPDAWFDARYNPGLAATTQTGWGAVMVASLTTLVGSGVLLFWIAMVVMYVYEAMGWLDGYRY